ncbi:MAG TPA: hypothetical protein DCX12_03150 [Chloroflexi bacterium]|nr:hypothetical protein [Chloroflexota bacterium]HBV93348.1 hypothetical protein [Chloroflexota bacterium]
MYGASDTGGAPVRSTSPDSSGLTLEGGGVGVGVGVAVGRGVEVGDGVGLSVRRGREVHAGFDTEQPPRPTTQVPGGGVAAWVSRAPPGFCSFELSSVVEAAGPAAAVTTNAASRLPSRQHKAKVFLNIIRVLHHCGRPGNRGHRSRQRVPVRRPFT